VEVIFDSRPARPFPGFRFRSLPQDGPVGVARPTFYRWWTFPPPDAASHSTFRARCFPQLAKHRSFSPPVLVEVSFSKFLSGCGRRLRGPSDTIFPEPSPLPFLSFPSYGSRKFPPRSPPPTLMTKFSCLLPWIVPLKRPFFTSPVFKLRLRSIRDPRR